MVLIALFATGCEKIQPSSDNALSGIEDYDSEKEYHIKIAAYPMATFEKRYGKILQTYLPNITWQVVDDIGYRQALLSEDLADLEEWLDQHNPDLIITSNINQYNQMIDQGWLYPIEHFILRDGIDLGVYVPGAIEILRSHVSRDLYGMATNFNNFAIFFNKTYFDELMIQYPPDPIRWEELLLLARRFSGERDIVGLYNLYQSPFGLIRAIAETEGITYSDPESHQNVIMNTENWRRIWESVVNAYRSGVIEDVAGHNLYEKNAAMIIGGFTEFKHLTNSDQTENWGIVHYPVNSVDGRYSNVMRVFNIITIRQHSHSITPAWEIMKVLSNESTARAEWNSPLDLGFSTITNANLSDVPEAFFHTSVRDTGNTEAQNRRSEIEKVSNQFFLQMMMDEMEIEEGLKQIEHTLNSLR